MSFPHVTYQPLRCPGRGLLVGLRSVDGPFLLIRVDRETLEKEFLELAELEGVSDVAELNEVLDRAVTLKNMLKNRDRVDKVAKFAAEHFRTNVEPMGYKAFMVAVDREACVFYKQALDKYLPPEDSVVVISPGGKKDQAAAASRRGDI